MNQEEAVKLAFQAGFQKEAKLSTLLKKPLARNYFARGAGKGALVGGGVGAIAPAIAHGTGLYEFENPGMAIGMGAGVGALGGGAGLAAKRLNVLAKNQDIYGTGVPTYEQIMESDHHTKEIENALEKHLSRRGKEIDYTWH